MSYADTALKPTPPEEQQGTQSHTPSINPGTGFPTEDAAIEYLAKVLVEAYFKQKNHEHIHQAQ